MSHWVNTLVGLVNATDRAWVRRSARLSRTVADPSMKALSKVANHSVLWFSLGAALACREGSPRRAALRGVGAIAAASATTNLLGKPLFPRRRPAAHLVAGHRRLSDPPTSSSFPSGHAGSAAAFTTAVVMECPRAALVVAPLSVAVGYSRVHTGVHWPSDVLCGFAIGTGMALATKHWWPLRPERPSATRPATSARSAHAGEGMLVLVNPESGDGGFAPRNWIAERWPAAQVHYPDPDSDLIGGLETVLDRVGNAPRILGVAGGDGTVASVASVARRHGLPLAVLPAGTLNHFARDVGADDPSAVAAAVERGSAVRVDLGTITSGDGRARWFLNTASIGGYPDMVRLREKWSPRWGKWPAAAAALARVLHDSTPLSMEINGIHHRVWALFVGNGTYAPRGFAPTWRPRLDNGTLDVRYVRADARFSRLRFVLAAVTGTLHRSRTYVEGDHRELEVIVHGEPVAVATDGEVGPRANHFTFTAHDNALSVYRPVQE